jgi:23S rRNA pseudouridine1911/1915/1917 synthase
VIQVEFYGALICDLSAERSEIEIQVEGKGERLDRWLADQLHDLSRSRLQKLIEQGQVWVNGQVCTSKKIVVQAGDRVHLAIPDPRPLNLQPESIPLEILYEDQDLLILNKPAGMVVHPAPGHDSGTLVHALLAHCEHLAGIGGVQRPGIVHRLDRDTSGAIAIAKTDQAHQSLQSQLKAKTAQREYLAIVYGSPKAESGTIDLPIGRHPVERKKMAIVPLEKGGRQAVTHWQVRERLGNYALMQFRLETGRTHQIRVHSAQIGHPIIGDPVYGSGRSIGVNLTGQVLHAWKLKLQHPSSGELIEAIAPLPKDFLTLLQILRQRFALHL